ncbi:MAG: hypothetical protein GYA23_12530 [Methanomicrobiales archaeon]|nr:hypothetical protein [Methanomicrobiales archaeon]
MEPDTNYPQSNPVPPGKKNPFISLILSLVPGLGQVYNGEPLRGVAFLLGVFLSAGICIFGFFGGLDFALLEIAIYLVVVTLIIWAGAAADAFIRAGRMNAGELPLTPANGWHMLLFLVGAIILAGIIFVVALLQFLIFAGEAMGSYAGMHAERHLNITVRAERVGSQVLITNVGGEPSGLEQYGVWINGVYQDQQLDATPGSTLLVNASGRNDTVKVRGCWISGSCQTFLNTVV